MTLKRNKCDGSEAGSTSCSAGFAGSPRKIAGYGWSPDLPDHRDFTYAAPAHVVRNTPSTVDLRGHCPSVYDQGQIGSCTANAIAGALEFERMKQGLNVFTPSRLFIYFNERAMEGTVASDSGAQIRDGIKSVGSQGDCPETMWPYVPTPAHKDGRFPPGSKPATQPDPTAYQVAIKYKAISYHSVAQNLADMKGCLAEGYPFVLGFTVFQGFESIDVAQGANAGWVPMPNSSDKSLGGHAVLAVGYDDDDRVFICRNSWGATWGDKGYFYMPYAYLIDDNLADDFWTIRIVE